MAVILVVDDEKDVVTLIKFLLEKDGHRVSEAHGGAEALKAVGQERPDLIVLDIMMPGMDGYTVNARLQESPETKGIPVLVLSARGQMRDLFQRTPNVAAYLEKPFEPTALRSRVAELLRAAGPKT